MPFPCVLELEVTLAQSPACWGRNINFQISFAWYFILLSDFIQTFIPVKQHKTAFPGRKFPFLSSSFENHFFINNLTSWPDSNKKITEMWAILHLNGSLKIVSIWPSILWAQHYGQRSKHFFLCFSFKSQDKHVVEDQFLLGLQM